MSWIKKAKSNVPAGYVPLEEKYVPAPPPAVQHALTLLKTNGIVLHEINVTPKYADTAYLGGGFSSKQHLIGEDITITFGVYDQEALKELNAWAEKHWHKGPKIW